MTRYSRLTGRALPEPTREYVHPPREIVDDTKARRAWLAAKLAEITASGRSAKITGVGSYQQISIKIERAKETVEQVRGFCQCCGGRWAVVGGKVSHHGYKRPGDGWQTPSCIGAREVPLSESCDVTKSARTSLLVSIERTREQMAEVPATLPVRVRDPKKAHLRYEDRYSVIEVTPAEADAHIAKYDRTNWSTGEVTPAWDVLLQKRNRNLASQIASMQDYVEHLTSLITRFDAGEFVGSTFSEQVEK